MKAAPKIAVHIGQLVLEGVPAAERDRIARDLESELARLFAREAPSPRDRSVGVVRAEVPGGDGATSLGVRIAAAVHRGARR